MQRLEIIKIPGVFLIIVFGLLLSMSPLNAQNNKIDSIIELGDDLLNLNDYKAAKEKYDQALNMNESYPPALEAKIQVLILMEKINKARKLVDDALKKNPYYTPFYLYKGKISIEKERFEEAKSALNKALNIADDPGQKMMNKIYVNLGAANQKTGNFQKALDFYSKALEINKKNPNVFIYRGYLYFKKEKYKEAIEDFKTVLELDPNNHYAHYNIGMSHYKMDNTYEAKDAFHKACELGNKNACKMLITKFIKSND